MKFRPGYLALAPLAPLGAAVAHAALTPRETSAYQPQPDPDRAMAYAEKLSAMIRCDTTSYANVREPEKFERFHALLAGLFPLVHEKLERTDIDGNLLYYWPGRAHDRPIVLMSHQDVVPAEGTWEHAPFSGDIADGKVWGRGASDTKCSVMAFFQAVEDTSRPTMSTSPRRARKSGRATARRSSLPSSSAAACGRFLSATRAAASSPSRSAASPATLPWSACLKRARRT